MLAIRLKRTGRSGHAQFRMIVQDSHFHPSRGRVVAYLGSYNPHTKTVQLDKELASKYLNNGAQPSDRAAKLLQSEGVKLPDWVKLSEPRNRAIRNPEKLRRNQPKEEAPAEAAKKPQDADTPAPETETPESATAPAEEAAAETPEPVDEPSATADAPAEEAEAAPADADIPAES